MSRAQDGSKVVIVLVKFMWPRTGHNKLLLLLEPMFMAIIYINTTLSNMTHATDQKGVEHVSSKCRPAVALAFEEMRAPYASEEEICVQKFGNAYQRKEIEKRMTHFESTFTSPNSSNGSAK